MAKVTAKISRRHVRRGGLKGLPADVRAGANDGLAVIGLAMLAFLKRLIQQGPKTGRIYRLYNPNRNHQASAPGQAPATDTGQLVSSAYEEHDVTALTVDVGLSDPKAKHLEYGTRNMGKRPMLAPTAKTFRERIPMLMKKAIKARIK